MPMVQRDGESMERNVSSVGSLPERMQALDATPTASPAELAAPAEVQDVSTATAIAAGIFVPLPAKQASFLEGYRGGGGDPAWEQRVLSMVECESGWRLDPPGTHLGLAQFAPGTWETVAGISGFWDYTNPYHVGYNVAVWMGMIAPDYGSSQGWPNCWS